MATDHLAFEDLLLKYGLVQFGRFADENGDFVPFKLNLDWMPSYPDVLNAAVELVTLRLRVNMPHLQPERILCTHDSIPLATLISAGVNIPLVYSRGRGEPAVRDLVGAYDINHPTLLITNAYTQLEPLLQLIGRADRVGLKVDTVFAPISCGIRDPHLDIGWGHSYDIGDFAKKMFERGQLSQQYVDTVLAWEQQHRKLQDD